MNHKESLGLSCTGRVLGYVSFQGSSTKTTVSNSKEPAVKRNDVLLGLLDMDIN